MLKTAVSGDSVSYQMFRFYHEFGITDTTIWSDLSFDRTQFILCAIKEEDIHTQIEPMALFLQLQTQSVTKL